MANRSHPLPLQATSGSYRLTVRLKIPKWTDTLTESNTPNPEQQSKAEGVTIPSLTPAKVRVDTTAGSLFVRRPRRTDWSSLEDVPIQELGLALIKLLVNCNEDKSDPSSLPSEIYEELTDVDLQTLAEAISDQNQWGHLPQSAGPKALGDYAAVALKDEHEKQQILLANLRNSINQGYSFLGDTTLNKLQKQMADMTKIKRGLFGPSLVGSTMRPASETIEHVAKPNRPPLNLESFIPKFEDTPLGRASYETVKNTRETADKMDNLAGVVADINQTLIAEVLPAWIKNVENGQTATKQAAMQAATSLAWTKWAVVLSVFVTVAATYWQVDVAKSLDKDSSEQQTRAEKVLREQLKSQGDLLEQQKVTESLLREQIAQLKNLTAKQSINEGLVREQAVGYQHLAEQISHSHAAIVEAIEKHQDQPPAPSR